MNVKTARKATNNWMKKATKENVEYNKKRQARELRISTALWKKRGPVLVSQIDGYIKKASANGHHGINEPSALNPNGDPIIWLDEGDRPIHYLLMKHYRDQGFTVVEYTPIALKIEW
jgi:hypothetical protein